jgi:serine/threonine protein kinase
VIGKGGFGRVWKVERKKFNTTYAMKEMSKCRIV